MRKSVPHASLEISDIIKLSNTLVLTELEYKALSSALVNIYRAYRSNPNHAALVVKCFYENVTVISQIDKKLGLPSAQFLTKWKESYVNLACSLAPSVVVDQLKPEIYWFRIAKALAEEMITDVGHMLPDKKSSAGKEGLMHVSVTDDSTSVDCDEGMISIEEVRCGGENKL